jgi:protease-4
MVAVMMDVAASGGYYIALAADSIMAHPTSVTGSIGVVMVTVNADGLLQKIGVTAAAIKSGPLKDMGSPLRALTPEERAIFQSVIDDLYGQFVAKVRSGGSPGQPRRWLRAHIHSQQQALADNLAWPASVRQARRRIRKAAGVSEERIVSGARAVTAAHPYFTRLPQRERETGSPSPVRSLLRLRGPGRPPVAQDPPLGGRGRASR